MIQNYYGSLCTEMYEILHKEAAQDELAFYISYAEKGMSILEPLCGSGRFLIPFLERGFNIFGMDLSEEMLAKLKGKNPNAKVVLGDILTFESKEQYDYIFISSGSVSLFTDMELFKAVLLRLKCLLKKGGKFIFAVDTIANRCPDDLDYKISKCVKTKDGFDLILKSKNNYDEKSHTQFSPSVYELYDGSKLLQREEMDFQTHLYEFGEMEPYLQEAGFTKITVYSSFNKTIAENNETDMFLYECSF
ncbi:MAG: class I SAM-dependent methyltransferase [Clostridiales bacterium]|nr:class I SAM-dependent methyltransferase [Clostridiales bacterium]